MTITHSDRQIIKQLFNMKDCLRQAGVDFSMKGTCMCPFHEADSNDKTNAKVFDDALHCFSESRQYDPVDALMRLLGWTEEMILQKISESGIAPSTLIEDEKFSIFEKEPITFAFEAGLQSSDDFVSHLVSCFKRR